MIERLLRRHYRSRDLMFASLGEGAALVAVAYLIPSHHSPLYAVAVWYFGIGLVGLVALTCIEFTARCIGLILHARAGTFWRSVWNAPSPPIWDLPLSFAGGFVVGAVILAVTPFLTLLYACALLTRLLRYAMATIAHAGVVFRVVTAPLVWRDSTVDAADLYQSVEQSAVYLRRVARILPLEMREDHTVAMVDSLYGLVHSGRCTTPGNVRLAARRIALEAVDVSMREQWGLSARFAPPAHTLQLLAAVLASSLASTIAALNTIASVISIATGHLTRYMLDLCILAVILAAIVGGIASVWHRAAPGRESSRAGVELE